MMFNFDDRVNGLQQHLNSQSNEEPFKTEATDIVERYFAEYYFLKTLCMGFCSTIAGLKNSDYEFYFNRGVQSNKLSALLPQAVSSVAHWTTKKADSGINHLHLQNINYLVSGWAMFSTNRPDAFNIMAENNNPKEIYDLLSKTLLKITDPSNISPPDNQKQFVIHHLASILENAHLGKDFPEESMKLIEHFDTLSHKFNLQYAETTKYSVLRLINGKTMESLAKHHPDLAENSLDSLLQLYGSTIKQNPKGGIAELYERGFLDTISNAPLNKQFEFIQNSMLIMPQNEDETAAPYLASHTRNGKAYTTEILNNRSEELNKILEANSKNMGIFIPHIPISYYEENGVPMKSEALFNFIKNDYKVS